MKKTILALTILSVSILSMALSPLKAEAAEWGVDMNLACRQQHGWINTAYIKDYNAFGWRCKAGNGNDYHFGRIGLNIALYCARNHGGARAVARNTHDPFSWRCVK